MDSFRVRWLSRRRLSGPFRFEFAMGAAVAVAVLGFARPSPAVDARRPAAVQRSLYAPVPARPTGPQVALALAPGAKGQPLLVTGGAPGEQGKNLNAPPRAAQIRAQMEALVNGAPRRQPAPFVFGAAPQPALGVAGTNVERSFDRCIIAVPDVDSHFIMTPRAMDEQMIVAPRVVGLPFGSEPDSSGR